MLKVFQIIFIFLINLLHHSKKIEYIVLNRPRYRQWLFQYVVQFSIYFPQVTFDWFELEDDEYDILENVNNSSGLFDFSSIELSIVWKILIILQLSLLLALVN